MKFWSFPREAVREGDRVAIVSDDNSIEFRNLSVVRANATDVFTSGGVSEGERVVLTRMAGAVEGMEVEVLAEDAQEASEQREGGE